MKAGRASPEIRPGLPRPTLSLMGPTDTCSARPTSACDNGRRRRPLKARHERFGFAEDLSIIHPVVMPPPPAPPMMMVMVVMMMAEEHVMMMVVMMVPLGELHLRRLGRRALVLRR